MEGFSQTQISTLAVKDNFLVAGGFQGELTCKVNPYHIRILSASDTSSNDEIILFIRGRLAVFYSISASGVCGQWEYIFIHSLFCYVIIYNEKIM